MMMTERTLAELSRQILPQSFNPSTQHSALPLNLLKIRYSALKPECLQLLPQRTISSSQNTVVFTASMNQIFVVALLAIAATASSTTVSVLSPTPRYSPADKAL